MVRRMARVQHTFACVAIDVRDAHLARRTLLTLCGRECVGRARMEVRAVEEEHTDGKEKTSRDPCLRPH